MNSEGYIEARAFTNIHGVIERREYKWKGGPKCRVALDFMNDGLSDVYRDKNNVIVIGPYRLKIIDYDWARDQANCIRLDYPFWWVIVGWHRINRIADLAYRRFIVTLAVWNLAHFRQGAYPSWKDIKLIQWFHNKWTNPNSKK